MMKRLFWLILLASGMAVPTIAPAQSFPDRPVRIIVPQTPGGASDALARIIGQKLGDKWGQTVVIENRPGAGGNVGMEAVIAARPDGYTLLMSYVGTQAINGALYKKLSFDPGKDFAPVATLATLPFVMVAKADAAFKTIPEILDAAKKGRITYGSAGNGSVNHLVGEMFNAAAKVKLVHIPYRGAAPALQDLMGGQIDLVFTSLPSVAGFIKSGTLHPIAVTSGRRVPSFNSIPTIAEAGFKDFDVNPWFGLMAPKKTPPDVILKINKDVNELLRSKDVMASFAAQGAEPYATSPDDFAAVLQADVVKWGEVVKASGAQVD
ncbi:Bug family tripartite tricarboxylate transporter substrate binding protein [Pollutimonas bauzanensis]|uniref:Tripartite-type tricarboxylate transporter, receptor component TctC n=1 Tax=Pollutimonas bauzanensis TaxID=658167 RepID=A0A1M5XXE3_9BURK|nr:tripartite tricarboxylate transporter substrate binding protein [Pollutimonas bauzanensis]SHI04487.1 Tripartite-type tricarboxylate transporter, receptor component TctC [Pollutimonas bauzanensis]